MKEKKRYRMTFYSGHRHRTLYASCAEEDLEGEKEAWAMKLEEETGIVWHCTSVTEVKAEEVYVGNRGGD